MSTVLASNSPDASFASGLISLEQLHATSEEPQKKTYIEQLYDKCKTRACPSAERIWLVGHDRVSSKLLIVHPTCKMWSCPACALNNARRLVARVVYGCNELQVATWYFVTLTAHSKMRGIDASYKSLQEGWKKLYNRMLRKVGRKFHYIKVYERHADDSLHLHLIVSEPLGTRWYKDNAAQCGMGYQAIEKALDVSDDASGNIGMVAGYVAKYMTKQCNDADHGRAWPKNIRRFDFSRGFPEKDFSADGGDDIDWTKCGDADQVIDTVNLINNVCRLAGNRLPQIHDPHGFKEKYVR